MGKEQDLIKAVKAKDINKVQKLLKSTSTKRKGENPAWRGVDTGHKIRIQLAHINVNTKEVDSGCTPLHLAVLEGLHDVADMLIFYSADVLAQDLKGNTALHLAVFVGRLDLVALLLSNGADVNSFNDDQNTPLHIACQHNIKLSIIWKLLQADANLWLYNKDDHTPLDTAAMYNKKNIVSVLMSFCPALISNRCALVEAAMRDNVDVLELLLEYGVNPNQLDFLRGSTALHETVRFSRIKSAEVLLAFGADAMKKNLKNETPHSLCKELPAALQDRFGSLFTEYSNRQPRIPQFLVQVDETLSDAVYLKYLKDYPPLPTQPSWTQNTREFCSSCTEANSNLHVVDDNPLTFWVIPELHDAWTTFDLGSPHIITGITIIGWDSPQMVQHFQLQVGDSVHGAWSTFTAHTCKRLGSANPKEPGVGQTFNGFTKKVRFLRLYIIDNHGGSSICFQGIRLHGIECSVFDFLQSNQKQHLHDRFVEKGINTYHRLLDVTESVLTAIIDDPVEILEVYQIIQAERRKVYPMTVLEWLITPVHYCYTNKELPDFSIQSNPGVTEEVEVKVEGAEIEGNTLVKLNSSEKGRASIAVFHGFCIKTVGKFVIRIQGVSTKMTLEAPDQIEIRPAQTRSSEVGAAFDEIQSMLNSIQDTL